MNPHQNANQNAAPTSAVQQVNPAMNPQMFNNNNNMPVVGPPGFTNFPNQPFPMQMTTGQFPNGIRGFNPQQNMIPFPVNQFNPCQQQPGQFFAHSSMTPNAYRPNVGLSGEQVLMQNTIQNIYQLLQLQNPNYAQCPPAGFPMFPNPMVNVMNPQNPGFPVQLGSNGPQNMGQQLQGNPFLPGASGPVQPQNPHATLANFQNQMPQGVGPQNQNFFTNPMFGMATLNGAMQNVSQGPPGFVSPMMDANASRQIISTGQTSNPSPTPTTFEENQKDMHTNFTGHKAYDPSHKRSKSHKHAKQKFGNYNGNINKAAEGGSNLEVDSVLRKCTNFVKKIPSLSYTEQEINEWREARKKNYPTNTTVLEKQQTLSDVTNQDAVLRRQQLKEILEKQAELGCEVAEVPGYYLFSPDEQNPRGTKHDKQNPRERKHDKQNPRERKHDKQNPRERKHERQRYKKGKFNNKRGGTPFQDAERIAKQAKPNDREPSLLEKLLTRDIKRDKIQLLQVLRFMTANSFFTGESSMRFPPVIVREASVDMPSKKTCSVIKVEEEEEGEIID